ncbi:MAG TPA: hypothetical protein VHB48_01530 [Chitinophagaceae bacterium]|nr:hypothetical protein [Chitinophagaceae bacterium]
MKKHTFIPYLTGLMALILFATRAEAQQTVNDIIAAERNFAAYAAAYNTRDAFMRFLDTAHSIELRNGQAIKSYETWNNRRPDSSKLKWRPAFAGIAKSGDLGFTTGPWEYRKSAGEQPVASGEFATIWHLNSKGEWKFLVDIGTGFSEAAYSVDTVQKFNSTYSDIADDDPLTVDRRFTQQYAALGNNAFTAVITGDTWFVIDGNLPLKGMQNITAGYGLLPAGLQFIETGGGTSTAGDLCYVYGTARKADKIGNYLRVWQKTAGGYKLLLQVL